MCDMTHSYAWYKSFICVTRLIHMCNGTRSYAWHDSFMCDKAHSYVCPNSFICDTGLIHMCATTHSCVWHDPQESRSSAVSRGWTGWHGRCSAGRRRAAGGPGAPACCFCPRQNCRAGAHARTYARAHPHIPACACEQVCIDTYTHTHVHTRTHINARTYTCISPVALLFHGHASRYFLSCSLTQVCSRTHIRVRFLSLFLSHAHTDIVSLSFT